jgi:hypothetical protein
MLWQALILPGVLVACATTPVQEAVTRSTGKPCPNPRYVEFSDGSRFFQLTGRLVSRQGSTRVRPISSAEFLYWDARDNPDAKPLDTALDDAGNFTVEIGLPWSQQLMCREGEIVETEHVTEQHLVIRAYGCSDLKLTVDPKWVSHDVELDCKPIRRTG